MRPCPPIGAPRRLMPNRAWRTFLRRYERVHHHPWHAPAIAPCDVQHAQLRGAGLHAGPQGAPPGISSPLAGGANSSPAAVPWQSGGWGFSPVFGALGALGGFGAAGAGAWALLVGPFAIPGSVTTTTFVPIGSGGGGNGVPGIPSSSIPTSPSVPVPEPCTALLLAVPLIVLALLRLRAR